MKISWIIYLVSFVSGNSINNRLSVIYNVILCQNPPIFKAYFYSEIVFSLDKKVKLNALKT